ncbi:MAG: DUF2071 domain-containing protein [Planctomycetota bacterium]
MRWLDLAFLHWRVPAARIAPLLPAGLELDTFDGHAWLGVVPFEMDRTRFRFAPPIPTATRFPELNVRTYVRSAGRPGVWFFSLDAASRLAVRGARRSFHLPYFDAQMRIARRADGVHYTSRRTHRGAPPAHFEARYKATGPPCPGSPGTLEYFLTERYCLYSAGPRGMLRGEIHHGPWPLQPGEVELVTNDLTRLLGLTLDGPPETVHCVTSIDVRAWWPVPDSGHLQRAT